MSWSRQGYEKASYCISQTGRQPAMQSPTALPRIPASASGVSTQRFSPKRSRSPAVARKTPPARPTSSPMTMTVSSRSSSTCSASFTASTRKSSAIPALPKVGRREDVGVVEDQLGIRLRLGLGGRDSLPHHLERLVLDLLGHGVVEHAEPPEVALVAADAFVPLLLLDPREAGGVRHVCRDRDADRRDAVLRGVPPSGWVPPPPVEDRARRHPAQQPDRRLAVAREDPVLIGERVHGAGLHRLVVPEDRVRPDPALAVIDDRALVVRPQEDERAVDRNKIV